MKSDNFKRQFREFLERAERDMFPKMKGSSMAVSIIDGRGDARIALELGAAILFDKPLLVIVLKGTKVSPRLRQVADEYVETDSIQNPQDEAKIRAAIDRLVKKFEAGRGQPLQ